MQIQLQQPNESFSTLIHSDGNLKKSAEAGIRETYSHSSQEMLEPEAFFPVGKDATLVRAAQLAVLELLGSFSNDNGDGNENVINLHIQWAKTIALHAPHVRFSYLSISLPSSAKQQREITKFEVLRRTSALGDKFSFFSPKFSAARNGFIPEGPPHLCHIKKLGIVAK